MNHVRTLETADADGDSDDEGDRRRRHAWLWPVATGALLAFVGWSALRLLDNDRVLAVHAARITQLEKQYDTIDSKLDRLIERR